MVPIAAPTEKQANRIDRTNSSIKIITTSAAMVPIAQQQQKSKQNKGETISSQILLKTK